MYSSKPLAPVMRFAPLNPPSPFSPCVGEGGVKSPRPGTWERMATEGCGNLWLLRGGVRTADLRQVSL
jgi:hypothetical protein